MYNWLGWERKYIAQIDERLRGEAMHKEPDQSDEDFFKPLVDKLEGGLLRYAVGRQIFCPVCRGIMDFRDSTLIDWRDGDKDRTAVCHKRCEGRLRYTIANPIPAPPPPVAPVQDVTQLDLLGEE